MATIRNLKKDINYITSELIIECFTYDILFPDKNKEELSTIITDAVKFREGMLNQINQVKPAADVPLKVQFRKIRGSINEQVSEFVNRLSKLEQK